MKEQDKELLLKDLCARLPYGVMIHGKFPYSNGDVIVVEEKDEKLNVSVIDWIENGIEDVKPYLRPMSSMTQKEEKEYSKYAHFGNTLGDWTKSIDWLNAHHFDYRGLIPMGLALSATDGIYDFK